MTLYLSEADVAALLSPADAVEAVEALLPADGRGRRREPAALPARARSRGARGDGRVRSRTRLRGRQGLRGVRHGRPVRGAALPHRRARARRGDRRGQARPAAHRRRQRRRSPAPGPVRRDERRPDRLRLAGGVAARLHPRRRPDAGARRRLLPHRVDAARLLRAHGRGAGREPSRPGRVRRRRDRHHLPRPRPARRVASPRRARLRRRRERRAPPRGRQRRRPARARSSAATRSRTRSSSRPT